MIFPYLTELGLFLFKMLISVQEERVTHVFICYYVHVMFRGVKRGYRIPKIGVPCCCVLPFGCWELNPCPLEEQQMLVTTDTSLKPTFSHEVLSLLLFLYYLSTC